MCCFTDFWHRFTRALRRAWHGTTEAWRRVYKFLKQTRKQADAYYESLSGEGRGFFTALAGDVRQSWEWCARHRTPVRLFLQGVRGFLERLKTSRKLKAEYAEILSVVLTVAIVVLDRLA